jgi:hypothetical protein
MGAIELLETREDFDPVAEIKGILKGLQRWEGESYSIGSLLRRLPERTAAVVRRALMAGAVGGSAESNGVVAGQSEGRQSEQPEPPTEANPQPDPQPEPQPQAETEPPHPTEAVAGTPQTDADGGKAKSEVGKDRVQAARDIVRAFEMRQRGDGSFCYVYRTPDGNELETASCDPKAVKDFLGRLGLNIPLKDVRALLGLSKEPDAGEGEGKSKKKRKAETAEVEDIKAILWRYKWVRWQGDVWQVVGSKIYRADLDRIHSVLKQNGLEVGKETLKSHWAEITTSLPKGFLRGIVVTPEPTYGVVGSLRGLWYRHFGDLYLETPTETRIFSEGQWPEGVYTTDTGEEGILPDRNGEPKHILGYWEGITSRLAEDKRIPDEKLRRVTLAMFLPVLFGQGHIGLILYGAARSGKSTLLKALGYLRLGRKPRTPSGLNKRDLLAVLQRRQIVFFDEVKTITPELDEALRRMITHDGDEIRALYTDLGTVEADLEGSAVFCATRLSQLSSDLRTRCFVWHLEERGGSLYEQAILGFCEALWRLALGGAIKLYRMAARLKRPPNNILPEIRFRDWLAWAYRYAVVLEVEKEFVDYVKQAKRAAHSGGKYDFLIEVLSQPDFDASREYTITDLIALVEPTDAATGTDADEVKAQSVRAAKASQYALKSEAVRADLIALARDMGYNLRLEKKKVKGEKKPKYRFIFSRLEIPQESDRLRAILQRLGIEPDWEGDWDGESAPMAEPSPQDGHAPTPEVHSPPPAPQIAPPAAEPVPMAAKNTPAEVGGGTPIAPPPPEKPMAIAVPSAQSPKPTPPTPEQNERTIAGLREALARLPKPEGLLRQKGTRIEGWVYAVAPPELTEYLRAMGGALAAEAAMAAEKGRFAEAGGLLASAMEYLVHLTAFDPTREAIAAVFLARAAERAFVAAQSATQMGEAAGLLAKAAVAVFFGKAAPDVLLGVLLEAPYPTEYDPCLAPSYREAAGCLVAAHWVLTGGDPRRLSRWFLPGRWERDDVEAMLLFSLGSEKRAVACAHLYLGDLPF